MPYELERTIAREAALLAGQLCLAVRAEMLNDANKGHSEKAGREPVTVADYGAQSVILQHIAEQFPDDAAVAEEHASELTSLMEETDRNRVLRHVNDTTSQDATEADIQRWLEWGRGTDASRVWVVDPIDGTKGFLRGEQFAVAIGLLVDGQPVVGALACPMLPFGGSGALNARGIVATAIRGQGALIGPMDGSLSRPMNVSQRIDGNSGRIVESVEVEHTDHSFTADVLETVGIKGRPVRMDSQAKYAAVADGRAEIYLRNSRTVDYREKIWDHAAGVLIVEEAGGRVTDLDGKSLDFSLGSKLSNNRGILATNGPLHDALLDAIKTAAVPGS